jgi:hypothetical protein
MSDASDDLILAREVDARLALRGRRVRFSLLAPYGPYIGRGALRVVRVKTREDESAELLAGYESYERIEDAP